MMIGMQIEAYATNGSVRMFHSNPASADMTTALSSRLMVEATGYRVENDEADHETGQRHAEAEQAAGAEDRLTGLCLRHGPYVALAREARNGC